jgi:hypothetical protein
MRPAVGITIPRHVEKPEFEFLFKGTVEALSNDIRRHILNNILRPHNFKGQREVILLVRFKIQQLIDFYKTEMLHYRIQEILEQTRVFILITNRSFLDYNFQVQLDVDGINSFIDYEETTTGVKSGL